MEDKILYIRILGNNVNSFYEKRIKEGSKFLYLLWQKEGDRKGQKVKRVVRYQRQGQITSFDTVGEKEETLECVMQ
jgi:hypothetical protein